MASLSNFNQSTSFSTFIEIPSLLVTDEAADLDYAYSLKFETLWKELQEKGPIHARAKIGQEFYSQDCYKLKDKVQNHDVFGWQPTASRIEKSTPNSIMIIGAEKSNNKEYVYYVLSEEVTENENSFERQHQPSKDSRIYKVSHATFKLHLKEIYPPKILQSSTKDIFQRIYDSTK